MKGCFIPDFIKPGRCAVQAKYRPYNWIPKCRMLTKTGVCWLQWDGQNNNLWQGQYETCPLQEGDYEKRH